MKRIAIVGGGISGLAAAFAISEKKRSGAPVEYTLFEAAPRLGGVLVTDRVDGCLVEAGPDSFVTEKPWATDLCRRIGLGDQLIGSNDADRKTYILVKNRLVVMPDGLMFMVPTKILPTVFSRLFSLRTKIRMAQEWFHPPHRASEDETVAAMVERHYGPEMVDRLADPLLSGIYGGEATQLSVRAVLARFAEMEAKYGSLGRAMLAARAKMAAAKMPSRPLFTSLKDGMQQMVDTLVARLDPSALRKATAVQSAIPNENGWSVSLLDRSAEARDQHFDALIVALPAQAAAAVLRSADESLARELAEIRYSSSITAVLGYDEAVRRSLPPGFGFLVPRVEGRKLMAATFVHNKFPHRAPENRALLRCFIGGQYAEQFMSASDGDILRVVRDELRQIIGLTAEPLFARIYRWQRAMAQYGVGHLDRLNRIDARIEALRQKHQTLALAGNGFRGIGVPDCIRSGTEAATKVLSEVGISAA